MSQNQFTCVILKNILESMVNTPTTNRAGNILLGNLFIFVATIFFGINIPVVKLLIPKWLTAIDISTVRLVGGAVLFWIASCFVKTEPIQRWDWKNLILGGALGMFSFVTLFNLSLKYANPIDVSIIMTFPPVFVILMGVLFQHHKISRLEIVGVALSFVGAVIVIVNQHGGTKGPHEVLGDLLALSSTVCYAFYLVILEGPTHRYRPVNMLRWVFLFGAIPACLLIDGVIKAPMFHESAPEAWWLLAFIVFCPTFLAYFLVNPAIKLIGSEMVSMYQYLLPVIATIASVLMHLARLDMIQVLAMVIIVTGMLLTQRAKKRQSSIPSDGA